MYLSTFHILRPGLPRTTPYAKFKEQAVTAALQLTGRRHKVCTKRISYIVTYAIEMCLRHTGNWRSLAPTFPSPPAKCSEAL